MIRVLIPTLLMVSIPAISINASTVGSPVYGVFSNREMTISLWSDAEGYLINAVPQGGTTGNVMIGGSVTEESKPDRPVFRWSEGQLTYEIAYQSKDPSLIRFRIIYEGVETFNQLLSTTGD